MKINVYIFSIDFFFLIKKYIFFCWILAVFKKGKGARLDEFSRKVIH